MTGLESVLDGMITYIETELNAMEDTDSVLGTSTQLFREVGRGAIDKITRYPGAYVWLDYGDPAETYLAAVTHRVQFIIRVWINPNLGAQEKMDELIRIIGKIYDEFLGTSTARSMGGSVQRRSPRRYLLYPRGSGGIITNAADIRFEVETKFRVE